MTKEECVALLERYAEYNGIGIPNLAGCREAMKMAAQLLSQPSLPSGLDEAAKQFQGRWDNDQSPEASFKAGAQWHDSQIPKLPDSIDEAAEEYAYTNWEDNDYHTGASEGLPFDAIGHTERCFKAGAEWMAGKGTTVRKKIGKIDDGVNQIPTYCNGFEVTELDVPFLNSKECGYGSEVIVQIRKK